MRHGLGLVMRSSLARSWGWFCCTERFGGVDLGIVDPISSVKELLCSACGEVVSRWVLDVVPRM